jgi:hypothetical protein
MAASHARADHPRIVDGASRSSLAVRRASLRNWLAEQEPLRLASSAGASSDVLAELAPVLERTRRPRLSADLQRGPLLPRPGYVAVLDEPAAIMAAIALAEGQVVELVPRQPTFAMSPSGTSGRLPGTPSALVLGYGVCRVRTYRAR